MYQRSHASKPRNKLIAQVFYDLEIIERYGSGIHRMLDACAAAGLPEPKLGESTGGFLIIFRKATKSPDIRHRGRFPEQITGEVTGEVAGEVTGEVRRLLDALKGTPLGRTELQMALGLKGQANFRDRYLLPALKTGLIGMTIPDKPNSRLQKYRLTVKGKSILQHGKS